MKRFSIFSIIMILLFSCLFTSCSNLNGSTSNLPEGNITSTTKNYFFYETFDRKEYLTFLENFDNTKYEIVDISVSFHAFHPGGENINHYAVTYKNIENKEG